MLDARLSLPTTRTSMHLDLRPLHAALARAHSPLDVLQTCEATAMPHGGGLWVAACLRPHACTYAAGPGPVPDAALRAVVDDMSATARRAALPEGEELSRDVVARWRVPQSDAPDPSREYAQEEILAGGECYGLLRVTRDAAQHADACDWEAVESVMCAAIPHLALCLQREAESTRTDPLTGLCTSHELRRRVEQEVEGVLRHPVEFSLVIMEVSLGPGRSRNVLTADELAAVGEVLRTALRESDAAARMPDGRFALLLPMTSQRNALIATARITDRLRAHPALSPDLECRTGISGWTFEGPTAAELFVQANQALDCARSAGARGAFVFL